MNKKERGIITVESSMVLMLITLFILFLFSFGRVYRAQNLVSHAVLQSADAVALESYLRETAFENDVNDVVKLSSHITTSSAISAESLESLRTANVPKIAKDKFAAAIASTKDAADAKLRSLGVKDGIDGIDFSECTIDLTTDDVIVAITYIIEMQYPVFGANEIAVTKAAKAKTFGEILFAVTTKPNVPGWGSTSGDTKVTHGSTVQITAEPNYGYVFVGWDDGCTDATRDVVVEDAQNYVAIFEKDKFGVNLYTAIQYDQTFGFVNHTDYGIAEGDGTFSYLDEVTIKAIPAKHYKFVGWDDDGDGDIDSVENDRKIVVDKTYHIKAYFEPETYTVKVKSNNSEYGTATVKQGSKSGTSIEAQYKSKVNISASAKSEAKYKFEKWNNNDTKASTTVEVKGNDVYTASFYLNVYTVTFKNGSTTHHTTKVIRGSSIDGSKDYINTSMPSNPSSTGASFSRWVYNNATFNSSTRVNGNITVTAKWKYTVKLDANGGKINNNNTASYTVEEGSSFNFSNYTPYRNGFTFTGWYNGSTKYSGGKTISSNVTVYAGWSCKHKYDNGNSMYVAISSSGGGSCSNSVDVYRCNGCGHQYEERGFGACVYDGQCGTTHYNTNRYAKFPCTATGGAKHSWDQGFRCITCIHCGRLRNPKQVGTYKRWVSDQQWCAKHNNFDTMTKKVSGNHW